MSDTPARFSGSAPRKNRPDRDDDGGSKIQGAGRVAGPADSRTGPFLRDQSSRTMRPSTRGATSPAAAMASMTWAAPRTPALASIIRGARANMA